MKSLSWKSERGTSLIEILVVMVVLVVGIFTIIRIFPVGFDILQYTGNASVAHRLAEAEVEYWRNNSANLPEGIVAIQPGATLNSTVIDSTVRPNDFISGTGANGDNTDLRSVISAKLPKGGDLSEDEVDRWVGANRTRRILGEVTKIPAPAPVSWSGPDKVGSVYSLAYAPIDWPVNDPSPDIADQYIQIRGNSLTSVDLTGLAKDPLNAAISKLRPRQYGIDYNLGVVYLAPSPRPRQFIASYTYNTTDGPKVIHNDRIIVPATPANSPGSTVKLRVQVSGSDVFDKKYQTVEPGTDGLSPKFRYLTSTQAFTTDPYEYKVLARYALGVQFSAAIAFNPNGFNQFDKVPGGAQVPIKAQIDYTVKDWRILHQDITLPSTGQLRVRMALPFLKQAGVTTGETSLSPWAGMADSLQVPVSVIAVDIATGDVTVDTTKNYPNGFDVDFQNGTLYFNNASMTAYTPFGGTTKTNPAGRSYRMFYAVEGDWAVIPQKAFSSYDLLDFNRAFAASDGSLPVGTATINVKPNTFNNDSNGNYVQVLFPTTDEGKAVTYNYGYRTNKGQMKTVYGEEQQITSQARQTLEPWYATPVGGKNEVPKPYIKIYLPSDAAVANGNSFKNDFTLSEIRGTSFRAVTLWRDRSRWRMEAITTHLTRTST